MTGPMSNKSWYAIPTADIEYMIKSGQLIASYKNSIKHSSTLWRKLHWATDPDGLHQGLSQGGSNCESC